MDRPITTIFMLMPIDGEAEAECLTLDHNGLYSAAKQKRRELADPAK